MEKEFIKNKRQIEACELLAVKKYSLLYGGARSGKTFILVRNLILRALKAPGSRHLILRLRFNHCKQSIWYDTFPKVMHVCFPGLIAKGNKNDWFWEFPNGSQIWIGGLDEKERVEKILGKEYSTIYFNEASQISFKSYKVALTRLAQRIPELVNRVYLDCNPPNKRHWLYQLFVKHVDPETGRSVNRLDMFGLLQMNPMDNTKNISEDYIRDVLDEMSERERKRFRDGEFMDDADGAMFSWKYLARDRVPKAPEGMTITVGVDPAVSAGERSDLTGIVACGRKKIGDLNHFYVLCDESLKGSPHKWGMVVSKIWRKYQANRVVGEVNQGGDLVESNIRAIDQYIPFRKVRATKGKMIRTEPVSNLSEKGQLHFVGEGMPELEEECTSWVPDSGCPSPNRMDAMVWAMFDLMGITKTAGLW